MHENHGRKLLTLIGILCLLCLPCAFAQHPVRIENSHNATVMAWIPWIIVILAGLLMMCGGLLFWALTLKKRMASRTRNLEAEIHTRQQIEAALRASEQRYRMLFEEAPLSLWEEDFSAVKQDLDRLKETGVTDYHAYFDAHPEEISRCIALVNVVDVNHVTLKLYQSQSKAGLVGSLQHVIGKEAYAEVFREIMALAEGQTTFEIELRNRTIAGQSLHIHLKWVVAPGYEDTWARVLIAIVDITDRKRAEEALRENEMRFRQIYEHMRIGVAEISLDFVVIRANQAYCDMLGYREDELRGKHLREFTHPDIIAENLRQQQLLAQGLIEHYQMEKIFLHKDGHSVYGLLDANLIRNAAHQPAYFLGSVLDITDRKRAEQQFKEHARLLEEAVQQKQREMEVLFEKLLRQEKLVTIGQMVGSIAHELRNPLGAVKQSVYYLKRLAQTQQLSASNPKVLRHLDLIDAELNTSERVIADLLEMTRQKPLHRQPTDFRTLAKDAIRRGHLPPPVQVSLTLEPEPLTLDVDPLQFRQVLVNVLTNAAQAIEGEGTITISAKELTEPAEFIIEIHDTGMGIAPEALPNVFEPLYTTKANGTGLGLCICKQIIENHQGRISLTSQPGQGTMVTIALPRG